MEEDVNYVNIARMYPSVPNHKAETRVGRRATYHHGDLRRTLLEQALVLLERGDSADINLRELTRRAGVSAPALYRHFADKEALLVALAVEGFSRLTRAQVDAYDAEYPERQSPFDAYRAGGLAYVGFARRHPALFRLMFGRFAATQNDASLTRASRENGDAFMTGARAMLSPDASDQHIQATVVAAWSLVHGLSQLLLDQQLDETDTNLDDLAVSVIERFVQWVEISQELP